MTEPMTTPPEIEQMADVLWSYLDLNGHTREGVLRTAQAAYAIVKPWRDALEQIEQQDYAPMQTEHGESFTAAAAEIARTALRKDR